MTKTQITGCDCNWKGACKKCKARHQANADFFRTHLNPNANDGHGNSVAQLIAFCESAAQ